MLVNTNKIGSMSKANQNFSKVAKIVDKNKSVVIMKNNKTKYVVLNFEEFTKEAVVSEEQTFDKIANKVLKDNIETFKELADK
ncbi:type II toxin-antitoxin system prevent-host-death family antitoxin [Clostridium luticellarii]|uniref:Antitoxin n=1 Tax=Clostridium luticellarii TaxID=1691940 RepID=A0A2T0B1P4_9CLOT|nr:type II toxin-antitoxin system prevent-host-death family antitoxin [Clostridium luticellarii]PRR77636.1 hypothetical protein CLLU_36960 [Clostridium luticellarii]